MSRPVALTLWLIASLGALVAVIAGLVAALWAPDSAYWRNLIIGKDQLINALFGGDRDETVSSRLGKRRRQCPVCDWICRLLNWLDPGHCELSIEPDEGKDAVIR